MDKVEAFYMAIKLLNEKLAHHKSREEILWRQYDVLLDKARKAEYSSVRDAYNMEAERVAVEARENDVEIDKTSDAIETLRGM